MLSTTVAGVFNGSSVSAFAQNVGLVAVTGIKSRFVVVVSGVILFLLGLSPVLGAIVAVVPLRRHRTATRCRWRACVAGR